MRCIRGSTSQSTKRMTSSANCATRTAQRSRRSRRSQSPYCVLAVGVVSAFDMSAFDMDLELLPEGVEIAVELGGIAGRERGRAQAVRGRERYPVLGFDPPGAPRQHHDPLGHADGFADVVSDEDCGLALAAQNLRNLIRER